MRAAAAILALSVHLVPAGARAELTVGLLGVSTQGEVPADVGPALEHALAAGLAARELEPVSSPTLASEMGGSPTEVEACIEARCLEPLARATGIAAVVRMSIRGSLNVYVFRLEALSTTGGRLATVDGGCDICNLAELRAAVQAAASRLAEELPRSAVVRLTVTPEHARVSVDGERVETRELALAPGEHVVSAEVEGFARAEERVELVLGAETEVRLVLERRAEGGGGEAGPQPGQGSAGTRAAGWALVAVGAATLVAGLVDVGLDGVCYGDERNSAGVCAEVFTTLWIGVGLVAGGAALAATGLALVLVGRSRARQARVLAPGLSLGLGGPGGSVGLTALGRF